MSKDTYRASYFEIDQSWLPSIHGFTCGQKWNGWDCPLFGLAEAEAIFRMLRTRQSVHENYYFDITRDTFVIEDTYFDEPEIFQGIDITLVDGSTVHVYGIGWGSWIWDESYCKVTDPIYASLASLDLLSDYDSANA